MQSKTRRGKCSQHKLAGEIETCEKRKWSYWPQIKFNAENNLCFSQYASWQHLIKGCILFCLWSILATGGIAREQVLLDANWRFHQGDLQVPPTADAIPRLECEQWRSVQLPHDWSIEHAPSSKSASAGGGGFFPAGIGWYCRELEISNEFSDKLVFLEFEGVYQNAEVWVNGASLGKHTYGYTPFKFDVTNKVSFEQPNQIVVRVDNSQQPNSRWYSGSGIYRHVWLQVVDKLHVEKDQVFVTTTQTSTQGATVAIEVPVYNATDKPQEFAFEAEIVDSAGTRAASWSWEYLVEANKSTTIDRSLLIHQPRLWSPEQPDLYNLRLRIRSQLGREENCSIPFGIRTVSVSAEQGFKLNRRSMELCGANVHHDNGPLGVAAFDRAEMRHVHLLKQAGFNAIRTSHNPPSKAFLHACDRLGMLVVVEFFDGWAAKKSKYDYGRVFHQQWQDDIRSTVIRDRNHPSVIMWSIGNEVFERGNEAGRQLAREMTTRVKQIDASRPVTMGLNGLAKPEDWPELDPMFAPLDVAGYNYELHRSVDDHIRLPSRVIYCSESYATNAFANWDLCKSAVYVIGDFVWSGMDYLGESGIGQVYRDGETLKDHWEGSHFPWHGATCGDLDITGWRKPLSHYRNIIWNRGEKIYAAVQVPESNGKQWQLTKWAHTPLLPCWTWPNRVGKPMTVEVYSRYPSVRLYLDNRLIGEKATTNAEQFRTEFQLPYQPGALRAVGIVDGEEQQAFELTTAGPPYALRFATDRTELYADGQDIAFNTVEVVDQQGNRCWHVDTSVEYQLTGPASFAAIGSADLRSQETYLANPRRVFQGRALVVVRSTTNVGKVLLSASAPNLLAASVELDFAEPE